MISLVCPHLPYTTWGLIQDLKTKRIDSDIYTERERQREKYIYFKNEEERRLSIEEEKKRIHKEIYINSKER